MKKILSLSLVVLMMAGCYNSRKVSRVDPDKTIDLSGRWNDTDSRLVAEEMVRDGLSRPWLERFTEKAGERPVVIVGDIKNKTSEHISTETFINDIEREFINSGQVRVVQGGEDREQMRQERADQQEYASQQTMNQWGREMGADFMMTGSVNSVTDQYGKDKVVLYQVDLELSDLETNEKVWIGNKKIKKTIQD
ncbi:MAG: penicillin-binding protein activator LpoB [Bacteroidetes bacterium]|nr:penicillin-binding protein activator LpoB [Bacteroidota bacterium]